jgi:hypothetical protein
LIRIHKSLKFNTKNALPKAAKVVVEAALSQLWSYVMAADGKRRKVIRKRKAKTAGRDRKRKLAREGSTQTAEAIFGDKKE